MEWFQPTGRAVSCGSARRPRIQQLAWLGLGCATAVAGPWNWDETFSPRFTTTQDITLTAVALQPDGRVLVAGNFLFVNDQLRPRLARLDAQGNLDASFDPGHGVEGSVAVLAVQPADGRILVGGRFGRVQGQPRAALARLEPNGQLDAAFAPRLTGQPTPVVKAVWVLPDGRILLAGKFQAVEGQPRDGLARLWPEGRLDESFEPGGGLQGGTALDLAVDAEGRIVVVGNFSAVDHWPSSGVARLLPDGRVDTTFAVQLLSGGQAATVHAVAVAPDGAVWIAGTFDTVGPQPQAQLARLKPDGQLDETFTFKGGLQGGLGAGFDLVIVPEKGVLLAGSFEWAANEERASLARLRADGALDADFNPGPGLWDEQGAVGYRLARQPDGAVIVAGKFSEAGGAPRQSLARFRPDGAVDKSFAAAGLRFETAGEVRALALEPEGALLAAGQFERVNGQPRPHLVRLLPNGQADPAFQPQFPAKSDVRALARDAAGRWLVGGEFDRVGDQPASNLARLLTDGRPDPAFSPPAFNGPVLVLAPSPEGGILVGGAFTRADPFRRLGLVRLLEDGSVDDGFDARCESSLADAEVRALVLDAAGRIWVGGRFHLVNGQPRPNLARLLPDGSLDPNYAAQLNWEGDVPEVHSLALTPDGRCVVGGSFQGVQQQPRAGLARLRPDGSLDLAFVPASTPAAAGTVKTVRHVLALRDYRVVAAGTETSKSGPPLLTFEVLDPEGRTLLRVESPADASAGPAGVVSAAAETLLVDGHLRGSVLLGTGLARLRIEPFQPELRVHIFREAELLAVDWLGQARLQQADQPGGPWEDVPGAAAPLRLSPEVAAHRFFRLAR